MIPAAGLTLWDWALLSTGLGRPYVRHLRLGGQLLLKRGLDAAAVQGVALSGDRAGQRDVRVGRGTRDEPFVVTPLCADLDGFSLHGAVRVAAGDRKRLERLCQYAGRPAIAESRLSLLPDGRVAYSLKKT